MKSVTKHILERAKLEELVKARFPECQVTEVTELTEGMFNSAYMISGGGALEQGAVLKIGPAPGTKVLTYEKELLKAEVQAYEILRDSGVPMPRVLAADFSRQLTGSDYFIMSRLEGDAWSNVEKERSVKCRPGLMEELGEVNALIHQKKGNNFGYLKEDTRYHFDTWYEAFYGMMNDILEDGRRDGHDLPYEEILDAVRRNRRYLEDVKEPRLVDYDIWAGNVFVKPAGEGLTVSGIIDFERVYYGDPCADFTSAFALFDDVEREPDFIKGYERASGGPLRIGTSERVRMELYRLYMAVILGVETYRYETEIALGRQEHCKKWIRELLGKLG